MSLLFIESNCRLKKHGHRRCPSDISRPGGQKMDERSHARHKAEYHVRVYERRLDRRSLSEFQVNDVEQHLQPHQPFSHYSRLFTSQWVGFGLQQYLQRLHPPQHHSHQHKKPLHHPLQTNMKMPPQNRSPATKSPKKNSTPSSKNSPPTPPSPAQNTTASVIPPLPPPTNPPPSPSPSNSSQPPCPAAKPSTPPSTATPSAANSTTSTGTGAYVLARKRGESGGFV